MFASKWSSFPVVRAAVLAAPLLLLAACGPDYGPGPMPTGYMYQNTQYKAVPGPTTMTRNEKEVRAYHPGGHHGGMTHAAPAYGVTSWDAAALDLIDRMLRELGRPMENVYVTPGAYTDLEYALGNAMTARGVRVSPVPGEGPFTLQYVVTPMADNSGVSITLLSVGAAVHEVSGVYRIGHGPAVSAAPVHAVETAAPMPILPVPGYN